MAKKPVKIKKGLRFNEGKPQWHMLPFDALVGFIRVIEYGATKYAKRNWELGMEYSTVFDCAQRHLTAWWMRDPFDKESGLSHLWHAGVNIMFLITYEMRGFVKYDDRPEIFIVPVINSHEAPKKKA